MRTKFIAFTAFALLLCAATPVPSPIPALPDQAQDKHEQPVPDPLPDANLSVTAAVAIECHGVTIAAGSGTAAIQTKINANVVDTVFCFAPGIYVLNGLVRLKDGNKMICTVSRACVMTGQDRYRGGFASPSGTSRQVIKGFVMEHFTHVEGSWPISPLQVRQFGVIEDNESRYNYQGLDVTSGMILRGNYVHHNARYGIAGGPGDDILIEGNEVSFNNTGHFDPNDDAGGSKIVGTRGAGTHRLTWRRNFVHDNYGQGIWSDGNVRDVIYEGNRVENNFGAGIFHEISWSAIIRNNWLRNNNTFQLTRSESCWHSSDIGLNNSQDVEIYGNTVEPGLNRNPLCLVSSTRSSTQTAFPQSTSNVNVHNNVFKTRGQTQIGFVGESRANQIRFSANTYYMDDFSRRAWAYEAYPITLQQWKARGQDLNGTFIRW